MLFTHYYKWKWSLPLGSPLWHRNRLHVTRMGVKNSHQDQKSLTFQEASAIISLFCSGPFFCCGSALKKSFIRKAFLQSVLVWGHVSKSVSLRRLSASVSSLQAFRKGASRKNNQISLQQYKIRLCLQLLKFLVLSNRDRCRKLKKHYKQSNKCLVSRN